jgi:sulfatase modifying factor 1
VKVTGAATPFCIDTTETTNAQYAQFVASGFALSGAAVPLGCTAPIAATPTSNWPPLRGYENFPVSQVNWCQAFSFCAWAGKRLCGEIGGGALAKVNRTSASDSQWFDVCSAGGTVTYPYGNTFSSTACGGMAANSMTAIVRSHPQCVGGIPGVYDMSGSLWEWTDACDGNDPTQACDAMGGAFDSTPSELVCASYRPWGRDAAAGNIGIRCCQDL